MPAFLKRVNYRTKPDTILYVTNMWEHRLFCTFIPAPIGSSPRVWGTPICANASDNLRRFIPTCVGNTENRICPSQYGPVHPHVCGEHLRANRNMLVICGSSPRVWGTRAIRITGPLLRRFIPTCVGNTRRGYRHRTFLAVHPHVCGEHGVNRPVIVQHRGSSPRVWGTLYGGHRCDTHFRFIPTCVGNTKSWQPSN